MNEVEPAVAGVTLLVIDEAARVRDDLYRSVRPMLAVSEGRLVSLSTEPYPAVGSWRWRALSIPTFPTA